MQSEPAASFLNPLPGVVWLLVSAILAVEGVLALSALGFIAVPGAEGWRLQAVQHFGFSPAVLAWMLENHRFPVQHLWRFASYPLVHLNTMHAGFVVVFLLALGKFAGERFNGWALLLLLWLAASGGALAYGLAFPAGNWLAGGYPMVFALLGVYLWLVFAGRATAAQNRKKAMALIVLLLGLRFLVGELVIGSHDWLADLAATLIGFVLCFLMAPGSLARLRRG